MFSQCEQHCASGLGPRKRLAQLSSPVRLVQTVMYQRSRTILLRYLMCSTAIAFSALLGCGESIHEPMIPGLSVRTDGIGFSSEDLVGLEFRNTYQRAVLVDWCQKFVSVNLEVHTDTGWSFVFKSRQDCSFRQSFTIRPGERFYTHFSLDLWRDLPIGAYRVRTSYCYTSGTCPDVFIYSNPFIVWK